MIAECNGGVYVDLVLRGGIGQTKEKDPIDDRRRSQKKLTLNTASRDEITLPGQYLAWLGHGGFLLFPFGKTKSKTVAMP